MSETTRTCRTTLTEFNVVEDHVHLLVEYPPTVQISILVNLPKRVSARILGKEFPVTSRSSCGKDTSDHRRSLPGPVVLRFCRSSPSTLLGTSLARRSRSEQAARVATAYQSSPMFAISALQGREALTNKEIRKPEYELHLHSSARKQLPWAERLGAR
ncbi:MAG: IS200/IS605 family transposase [Acidimicrobiales bacterium]